MLYRRMVHLFEASRLDARKRDQEIIDGAVELPC